MPEAPSPHTPSPHTPRPHRLDWIDSSVSRRALLAGAGGTGLAALLAACTSAGTKAAGPTSRAVTTPVPQTTAPHTTATAPSTSASTTAAPATKVRVTTPFADGTEVGVGMPVILSFDPTPTDAAAFVKAAKVTVNGEPVDGAWNWSHHLAGEPVQAHYRTETYWPPNATIKVELPIGGLSAGKGMVYRDELTSVTLKTGDKRVTRVDGHTLRAVVEVNDKVVRTMKVSLGAPATPTHNGVKLVMQKGEDVPGTNQLRPDGTVRMEDEGHHYVDFVPWSVRITTSGEYLHAASWNHRLGEISSSNGCTNLSVTDGKWFYNFARIGDVVIHTNTGGTEVPDWDGYADWNTPWSTWVKGGLLPPT